MTTIRSRKPIRRRVPSPSAKQRQKRRLQRKPIEEGIERLLSKQRLPALNFSLVNHPQAVSATRDYLKQLSWRISHFFGVERQDAAHFLFLIWMHCFGSVSDYDLAKGLEQFQRDVKGAAIPKKPRGKKETEKVAFAKQERKNKTPYKEIARKWYEKKGELEEWLKMEAEDQQEIIRGFIDAVNQGKYRKKAV